MSGSDDVPPGSAPASSWSVRDPRPRDAVEEGVDVSEDRTARVGPGARWGDPIFVWHAAAAFLFVPLSSLVGLARPMSEVSGSVFVDVWTANLWGDLIFTGGTVLSFLACALFVRRALGHPVAAMRPVALAALPLSFGLTWFVYAASWNLTGPAFDDSAVGFFVMRAAGSGEVWTFVWEWGWMGIVVMAVSMPGVAFALAHLVGAESRSPNA